jgi:hypothetical protein
MHANLFEHETISSRDKLNRIWDAIPSNLSISEMEKLFIVRAVSAGHDADTAEAYLVGDASC